MVSQRRSEAVLELGQRLVAQLDAKDDLLASWMAHYIAELIHAAKNASPEAKVGAQESCAKAILELWRYRASLPREVRPVAEVDSILATLASLDDDRTDYRYYPAALREAKAADAEDKAKDWLALALDVDFTARRLIRTALQMAAERAVSTVKPWVDLLDEAGASPVVEASIVELRRDSGAAAKLDETRKRELTATLRRLEDFARIATALARDIRSELGTSETSESHISELDEDVPSEDNADNDEPGGDDASEPVAVEARDDPDHG